MATVIEPQRKQTQETAGNWLSSDYFRVWDKTPKESRFTVIFGDAVNLFQYNVALCGLVA